MQPIDWKSDTTDINWTKSIDADNEFKKKKVVEKDLDTEVVYFIYWNIRMTYEPSTEYDSCKCHLHTSYIDAQCSALTQHMYAEFNV